MQSSHLKLITLGPDDRQSLLGMIVDYPATGETRFDWQFKEVEDNVASARVIEKNGGVLENQAISPKTSKPICRYWIKL